MSFVRSFIALDLSPDLLSRLEQVIRQLRELLPGPSVRWLPVKNIHLTLKFLGDVSATNLDSLFKVLAAEAEKQPTFEISLGGLGAYPSNQRPRVIWVGVTAPEALSALHKGIDDETEALGYPGEERKFTPHLTIGRVSRNASSHEVRRISEALANTKLGSLGSLSIQEVHFYRSDLHPSGAEYTRLFSATLGEEG
jgi:2'-5' RNA ligase